MTLRLKYVHEDVDRHGNVRLYFKKRGGLKLRLRATLGTPEFSEAYHKALADSAVGRLAPAPRDVDAHHPKTGTFRWLCAEYMRSADFARLEPSSRHARRLSYDTMCQEPIAPGAAETFADFPLVRMSRKALLVLRDRKADLPGAANNRMKALRRMFAWAVEHEHLSHNPARDVAYLKETGTGLRAWTALEIAQFEARHLVGTRARLALALLLYTGVRRSDVIRLGRQHVRDGCFVFTAHKNRNRSPSRLELPILPDLQRTIDASPCGDLTYLVTEYGQPFTVAGFGNWFRDRCREAGLVGCGAHGLRKAGAVRVAEGGATEHQLMAIFGWKSIAEAQTYTRSASRKKMAGDAMRLLAVKR